MSKNALIVTYNIAYLPALCALLNALDYYGHTDLDVHIAHTQDLNPAWAKLLPLRDKLSFNIIAHPVEPLLNTSQCLYINLMFMRYKIAQIIGHNYDAIAHLDGDVTLLDNLMPYFHVAGETGLIPIGEFPHTETNLDYFKTNDPDWVAMAYPMANFPIFYNPERHLDMMKYIWEHMPAADNADRQRNNEMYVFNYALWACKKISFVLPLPGNTWVGDKYVYHETLATFTLGGVMGIYTFLFDRVHCIHNKYWKEGVAAGELERVDKAFPEIHERVANNIKVILDAHNFFTTQCKVKLSELL
jgi:hypothetical protein